LKRAGWTQRPTGAGAKHYVMTHKDKAGIVTIPRYRQIAKGTLTNIIEAAGLTVREFERLYR